MSRSAVPIGRNLAGGTGHENSGNDSETKEFTEHGSLLGAQSCHSDEVAFCTTGATSSTVAFRTFCSYRMFESEVRR